MSMTQATTGVTSSGNLLCPHCGAVLPASAAFCASCGERVSKKTMVLSSQEDTDLIARYQVTSLARRRPYLNLLFAFDTQLQRPVVIRDIDIDHTNAETQTAAAEIMQNEYDALRRQHIPSFMPVIDQRQVRGRLSVVTGWPSPLKPDAHFYTLQEVLEYNPTLPGERLALSWIASLCQAVEQLHQQGIVLGDLDPQAIIFTARDFTGPAALPPAGGPALTVFWLPPAMRNLLPPPTPVLHADVVGFRAPEALLGAPEPASDIYSLGALLYLLLTSLPPDPPDLRKQRPQRALREVNPRISNDTSALVMQALALDSAHRFQSASALAQALARRIASLSSQPPARPRAAETRARSPLQEFARHSDHNPGDRAAIETLLVKQETLSEEAQIANREGPPPLSPQAQSPWAKDTAPPAQQSQSGIAAGQSFMQHFKQRITGILPAIPRSQLPSPPARARNLPPPPAPRQPSSSSNQPLLQQLRRLLTGELRSPSTVAIIETPLRVQPDQPYTIRIQVLGRNKPTTTPTNAQEHSATQQSHDRGLSAFAEGDAISIEVRSALTSGYGYIVQQTSIYLPAQGYAAEVSIPMRPLSFGPNGRRERLHICFTDEKHGQLYKKPVVVEILISSLVQPGREGHNIITIPY